MHVHVPAILQPKPDLIVKRFLLVIFHFFAESKKSKHETARPDARPYVSEPGIISIARDGRAGIFTNPGPAHFPATSHVKGEGEQT